MWEQWVYFLVFERVLAGVNFGSCLAPPFGVWNFSEFRSFASCCGAPSARFSVWQEMDWIANESVWVATSPISIWLFGVVATSSLLFSSDVRVSKPYIINRCNLSLINDNKWNYRIYWCWNNLSYQHTFDVLNVLM